jgi:hypothetical protein
MQKKSGFILMAVLAILALALSGASVFVYATRMPDPTTTDTRGLFRWLVTRDLSQESPTLQDSILSRLELELHKGLDVGDVGKQLTPPQRAQLVHNADYLGRLWFLRQVDRYFSQLDSKRLVFLSQQIDEIQRSGVAETLAKLMAGRRELRPKTCGRASTSGFAAGPSRFRRIAKARSISSSRRCKAICFGARCEILSARRRFR